jgi:sec-independent protein translocase protein TatB
MLDIGFSEIVLLGAVALIVLGPDKLPIAARTAGRWYAHIRRLVTNVQRDIEQELQLAEMRDQMQKELSRIKDMEQSMQQQLNQMNENLAELNPVDRSGNIDETSSNNTITLSQPTISVYLPIQPTMTILHQQPWQLNQRKKLMIEMQKTVLMPSKSFEAVNAPAPELTTS